MRPASFHARRVARWVRQSSRLWICIRSMRSDAQQAHRRFHLAHAFGAAARSRPWSRGRPRRAGLLAASSSPVVASARPYIGELSSTLPPASSSAPTTPGSSAYPGVPGAGRSRRRCRSRSPAALRRSKGSGGCSSGGRCGLATGRAGTGSKRATARRRRGRAARATARRRRRSGHRRDGDLALNRSSRSPAHDAPTASPARRGPAGGRSPPSSRRPRRCAGAGTGRWSRR